MAKEITRRNLLDAAEILFADKGFDAVSVREIANAAKANLAAINYHFQGKEKLYQAVLQRRLVAKRETILSAIDRVASEAEGQPSVEILIRTFVSVYMEDALITPEGELVMRLISREIIDPNYGAETVCREMIAPVHSGFAEVLIRAMPDLPKEKVYMILGSIISQVVHFMMRWRNISPNRQDEHKAEVFRRTFPEINDSVEEYIEMVINHVTEFTLGGIAAIRGEMKT